MKHINLEDFVGSFAENKDKAREIRLSYIIPALANNEEVIIDFLNVDSATQSFIHALLSDVIRKYSIDVLDKISFKSCNETIRKIITIVIDYMQESD